MNLYKTSFFSAIETAIKLASGFVVLKFIALETGPEGVAFFGQFQNFMAALVILVSGCFTTGLVRYSAQEYQQNNNQIATKYLGNALGLGLILSIVLGLLIAFNAEWLAEATLKNASYRYVFYVVALCIIPIMLYQVFIALFNGWSELYKLIICKSIASLLLLCSAITLVNSYGLAGGLLALVIMQAAAAFIGLFLISRIKNFQWQWLIPKCDFAIYKQFVPYALMSLVTLISTPLILILIREYAAAHIGWSETGLWEASWKICELYLLVITTALTTYYVPKLSQAHDALAEKYLVKQVLLFGVSAAILLALGIFLFRDWIVYLLFSNHFAGVAGIIVFQLIGSIVKVATWVFTYHMLVKQKTILFLSAELIFGFSFYYLSCYALDHFGLIGLSYAYFLNYALYLIFCMAYYYLTYRPRINSLTYNSQLTNN